MHRLSSLPYRDRTRAVRELAALGPQLPPAVQNRFDLLLASSPAPEQGLHYFMRLREQHPAAFDRLTRSALGLRHLVAVFTYSTFLSEEILEHPEWAEQLLDPGYLWCSYSYDRIGSTPELWHFSKADRGGSRRRARGMVVRKRARRLADGRALALRRKPG